MIQQLLILWSLAWRNLWRNKRRTFFTLLAIAFGLGSSIVLCSIARGVSNQMVENQIKTLTGHVQLHAPGYVQDPVVDLSFSADKPGVREALSTPEITAWAGRVRVPAVVASERDSAGVTLLGIEPEAERGLSFIPDSLREGRYLQSADEAGIILGAKLAEVLQTAVGKRVVLMAEHVDGHIAERGMRVIGIFKTELEATERSFVFVGRKQAQDLLGLNGRVSEIAVRTASRELVEPVWNSLRAEFADLDIQPWWVLEPFTLALVKVQDGFLSIWLMIVVSAVAFGLINTLFMVLFERTREFGLLQALGLKPWGIVLQVLFESILLLALGAIAGNLLGTLGIKLLSGGIDLTRFTQGAQFAGIGHVIYPHPQVRDISLANLVIVVLSIIASLYPAWRASQLRPVEALRKH